jgi:hypothetical protein
LEILGSQACCCSVSLSLLLLFSTPSFRTTKEIGDVLAPLYWCA